MTEETKSLTFYIYCKFCPRRVMVASKNYKYFVENGLRLVDNPKDADLIIIHSCGGFNLDEKFSLLTLENALKVKKNSAKVIMTGCLPKINKNALIPYEGVLIIPTEELSTLDSLIGAKIPYNSISDSSIVYGVNELYHGTLITRIKRNLGFNRKLLTILKGYLVRKLLNKTESPFFDKETFKIEISKGCLGNCTYCAIKFANPSFHSTPEEQIVENFRFGLKQKFKNFALTGADIGAYGIDVGTNLANLLKKILAIEGNYNVILIDMNARWLVKYYKELFFVLKKNAEKISKIIVPIQSGSNRILGLMKRNYTIDEVKKCILDLHEKIPTLKMETHLMVGFPSETEEDFQMSLNLLSDLPFSKVEIYRYEDRPGTIASKLTHKVSDKTMNKRVKILAKSAKAKKIKAVYAYSCI